MASHLENAARLDAAGQHDEAINELARGTRERDPDCTRLLGLRLLGGDRAPLLPAEGLGFLDELCAQGLGEGAARAAGVLALGVHHPSNWTLALEWLRKSAAAGWEPAQRQLLALCDDRALAQQSRAARNTDWKSIAAAVDLEAWRRSPPADIKCQEPRISVFRDLLRPEI